MSRSTRSSAPRSYHSESWSSQSTQDTQLSSDDDSPSSKPTTCKLMPKPPPDTGSDHRLARVAQFRRAFKRDVFDNVDVDWRSLPVLEESDLHRTQLLMRPNLRCESSYEHLARIVADARASLRTCDIDDYNFARFQIDDEEHDRHSQSTKHNTIVSRDSHQTTVTIAGTEMVDMIG